MRGQPLFFGPLLYFRTVPALEGLSSAQLGAIAQHAEEEFFPAGSPLLAPGEPGESFFVIVEGQVAVRSVSGRWEVRGPGEAVGFLSLLARYGKEVEARAEWDTLALRVDWDAHLDVCERSFPVLESHIRYLATRCHEESSRIQAGGGGAPLTSARDDPNAIGAIVPPDLVGGPGNLVRRLQVLHRSRVFPSSNMDALAELGRHLQEVRLIPGEEIWKAGEVWDSFLLLDSGEVEMEAPGVEMRQAMAPPEVAGWIEALGRKAFPTTLRCTSAGLAMKVGVDPLMDILEDHFTMALEFTAVLARELLLLQEEGQGKGSPRAV